MRVSAYARGIILLTAFTCLLIGCSKKVYEYQIGRDSSWYPVQMLGKEQNMVAFTNEVMRDIAKAGNFHFEIDEANYRSMFGRLDQGVFDGIFSTKNPNSVNREHYIFSDPFFRTGPVLIVRKSVDVSSLEEMEGKVVGVLYDTPLIFDTEKYPSIIVVPFDNLTHVLDQLENNQIDGVLLPLVPAYMYTQGFYANSLKIVTEPLTDDGVRLVTLNDPKGAKLIRRFNRGLKKVRDSGQFIKLVDKWSIVDSVPN